MTTPITYHYTTSFEENWNMHTVVVKFDSVISDRARVIFQWVFYAVLCQFVDIFGTVTNIINIICFVKQGFNDPVSISLLGLAISDFCSLVPLIWTCICYNPAFNELDLNFEPIEMQYMTGAWPHNIFSRISSWITAFITLERCLCITIPLKVKTIITPKKTTIIITHIFILLTVSVIPLYFVNRYATRYSPTRNKTIIGLIFTDDRENVEKFSFTINNIFIPGVAFLVIIIGTITLVASLRSKTKWRQKSVATEIAKSSQNRDYRVTKMVTAISILFIVCYLPVCIVIAFIIIEPEMSIAGKYRNTLIAFCGICFFLESANSASNIFIYYYMSSRYRTVFRQIFMRTEKSTSGGTCPLK